MEEKRNEFEVRINSSFMADFLFWIVLLLGLQGAFFAELLSIWFWISVGLFIMGGFILFYDYRKQQLRFESQQLRVGTLIIETKEIEKISYTKYSTVLLLKNKPWYNKKYTISSRLKTDREALQTAIKNWLA